MAVIIFSWAFCFVLVMAKNDHVMWPFFLTRPKRCLIIHFASLGKPGFGGCIKNHLIYQMNQILGQSDNMVAVISEQQKNKISEQQKIVIRQHEKNE